ncbi:hypothetical protein DFQ04_0252 [Algoriphagus boseongensis]|uniref:Uncharacterized protein n=1 Tax=Algoriphagus boseongensis TaxID=1442587 RepID=A0A4R6T689_9BACT|nr:hypothetical protein [Algoriphagus boseongensis]TDQ18450.1 hypothetical protein DFQ04_0252 [Algoriphagus boseongensis]
MVIRTTSSEFLIEACESGVGCVYIYCNESEELERFFGSKIIELPVGSGWKFRTKTCKQDFAHALIQLVKEIDYKHFPGFKSLLV